MIQMVEMFYRYVSILQKWIGFVEKYFGILGMGFIVLLNFYGITSRYVFNRPILYVHELTILVAVSLFFIGMGLVFKSGSGITVDLLIDKLPQRFQYINTIVVHFIVLFFSSCLFWQTLKFMPILRRQSRVRSISYFLGIPDEVYYYAIGLGALSIFITFIHSLLEHILASETKGRKCISNGEGR